jgi:hypothetical protein
MSANDLICIHHTDGERVAAEILGERCLLCALTELREENESLKRKLAAADETHAHLLANRDTHLERDWQELRARLETSEVSEEGSIKRISRLEAKIHAARGLLMPLGSQPIPSILAIREAIQILS